MSVGLCNYRCLLAALFSTLILPTIARSQQQVIPDHPDERPSAPAAQANPAFQSDLLRYVEDNLPVQNASQNRHEAQCYEQLVLHARRLPDELLRRSASNRINFAHMFGEDRARYRGKLAHISGRLRRLRQFEPPETLAGLDDGLTALYEAWIFDEHFSDNPYCVIVTELPAGLEPGESLDRPVNTDAFFFKRYRYAAKDGWRDAPLLIGKTLHVPGETAAAPNSSLGQLPAQTVMVVASAIAAVLALAGGLAWWFRRNDRRTRRQLESLLRDSGLQPPDWEKSNR